MTYCVFVKLGFYIKTQKEVNDLIKDIKAACPEPVYEDIEILADKPYKPTNESKER